MVEKYQVSHIYNVESGDTDFDRNVLISNITDSPITIKCIPSSMNEVVEVTMFTGWNPVIVKAVREVNEGTLQYGW